MDAAEHIRRCAAIGCFCLFVAYLIGRIEGADFKTITICSSRTHPCGRWSQCSIFCHPVACSNLVESSEMPVAGLPGISVGFESSPDLLQIIHHLFLCVQPEQILVLTIGQDLLNPAWASGFLYEANEVHTHIQEVLSLSFTVSCLATRIILLHTNMLYEVSPAVRIYLSFSCSRLKSCHFQCCTGCHTEPLPKRRQFTALKEWVTFLHTQQD